MGIPNEYNPEDPSVMITSNIAGGMLFWDTDGLIQQLRDIADVLEQQKAAMGFMSLTITANGFEVKGVEQTVSEINAKRPSEIN